MRLLLVLGLVLTTTACGSLTHDSGKVQVAAGFYPLAWAAEQVGGHRVQVTNLTQPGAEPHDLELTIKETVAIAEADVVVYEKGFQPAVDDSVAQNAQGATLDAARRTPRTPGRCGRSWFASTTSTPAGSRTAPGTRS